MANRVRGRNSRKNYKRRRRAEIRSKKLLAQQASVIISNVTPPVQEIRDYYPSQKPYEKIQPEPTPQVITPAVIIPESIPAVVKPTPAIIPIVNPPVILSDCDKRLLDILSDPAKFQEFKSKVKAETVNKLIVVS